MLLARVTFWLVVVTTPTELPTSLALLQLATQGQLKVCASCPVAQPNAASLGKACRL